MFALKLWLVSFCSTVSVDDGILPNITCQYNVLSENIIELIQKGSVVYRHRFDEGSDPTFILMLNQIQILP